MSDSLDLIKQIVDVTLKNRMPMKRELTPVQQRLQRVIDEYDLPRPWEEFEGKNGSGG